MKFVSLLYLAAIASAACSNITSMPDCFEDTRCMIVFPFECTNKGSGMPFCADVVANMAYISDLEDMRTCYSKSEDTVCPWHSFTKQDEEQCLLFSRRKMQFYANFANFCRQGRDLLLSVR